MSAPTPTEELTFEQALEELEAIVTDLERGDATLQDAIARFERGTALARRCEDRLNEAEKKVAVLVEDGPDLVEVDLRTGEPLGGGE
jgi:exodeoxyribonuclease VII small subunit